QRELARRRRPRLGRGDPAAAHRQRHRVRPGVRAEGVTVTVALNPQTLPANDNVPGNHHAYSVRLSGQLFMQTGRMIAYYPEGSGVRFEPLTSASVGGFVATRFSAPLYTRDWVVATGAGHLLLGDRGYDINSYDLTDGNLTLRAGNLLAFDASLELKQS